MTASRDREDDAYEDDWDDDEADVDEDSEDEPTVPCPWCRCEILEDVPQCPSCKRFISAEDGAQPGKPVWVVVTALICLGVAIWLAFSMGGL
ncbi:MAG: hypothetical protein WCR51_03230 [Planctomycetia bacterium]